MQPADYAASIDLYTPWRGDFSAADEARFRDDKSALYRRVLEFLLSEEDLRQYCGFAPGAIPAAPQEQRRLIRALLTLRPARPFPAALWRDLDVLFCAEAADVKSAGKIAAVTDLPSADHLALWRGDITTLAADAVVNAANSALLGCFEPFHACIDNALHSAAGPRLREACAVLMQAQGRPEPTGQAKITRAYALPSRFVLHTVGPIVTELTPTIEQQQLLSACYTNCLECCRLANIGLMQAGQKTITSIAFCCISTGVFGYPQGEAAALAVNTVRGWLQRSSWKPQIIFNVFGAKDAALYAAIL